MTNKTTAFKTDCRVLRMKQEYPGYTGDVLWIIVSDLTEEQILKRYPEEVKPYTPFVHMTREMYVPIIRNKESRGGTMSNTNNSFVSSINNNSYANPSNSVFDDLFREYQRVIFRSIITSFGLDLLIHDQHGGDVDTIHNVRSIGADPQMKYKNTQNATAYDTRGDYSHKDVEGTGTNFQRTKHDARARYMEDPRNKTLNRTHQDNLMTLICTPLFLFTAISIHTAHVAPVAGCSSFSCRICLLLIGSGQNDAGNDGFYELILPKQAIFTHGSKFHYLLLRIGIYFDCGYVSAPHIYSIK